MKSRARSLTTIATMILTLAGACVAHAGGPTPDVREVTLPRVCKGGASGGQVCSDDTECPGSTCEINFLKGPGTTVSGVLTLMVDDDMSGFTACTSNCIPDAVGATVLLEIKKSGTTHLLTQTYANLFFGAAATDVVQALQIGPPLSDMFNPLTEFELQTNVEASNVLFNFLLQQADDQLANAIRAATGVSGRPVISVVPKKIEQFIYKNNTDNEVGSALRLKVKIRFVPL